MKISRYMYAAVHNMAWNAYEVAGQRFVVEHQTYRGIEDYRTFMAAKKRRALAEKTYHAANRLLIYLDPTNQIGYMAAYYRGFALYTGDDKIYRNPSGGEQN